MAIAGIILNIIAIVISAIFLFFIVITDDKEQPATTETTVATIEEYATLDKFNQIEPGMSYEEVVDIMKSEGTVFSESEVMNVNTIIYVWYAKNGIANMNVTFTDGKVISKTQLGLE